MITKRKIILALLLGWLIGAAIHEAKAGPFLDLDLATQLTDYRIDAETKSTANRYLGDGCTLAVVRIGYQTQSKKLWKFNVSAQGYYIHISDVLDVDDHGLDLIAAGVRIQ